jgi:lysophospholipase L1-like esterase
MKKIILLISLIMNQLEEVKTQTLSYLALGDSYTIGESVPIYESFPYQTVQLLRKNGLQIQAPEIVAKTGWTTDELKNGISNTKFLPKYDIVSLLIGVNNQYRGRSLEEYGKQFEELLFKAISFAGDNKKHVFVISIPDWGATPFAEGRDRNKIASEIDAFNALKKQITLRHQVAFIEITAGSREVSIDGTLVARDKLHPSGKEYAKWAEKLANAIQASTKL